jgi:hypothetical protein
MQKLQALESNQHVEAPIGEEAPPPPLLVMREEEKQVEMQPRGYSIKDDSDNIGLVTIDKFCGVDLQDTSSLMLAPWGPSPFFRSLFLKVGEHDRVFGLIADELSFVHDYYYSSLP